MIITMIIIIIKKLLQKTHPLVFVPGV